MANPKRAVSTADRRSVSTADKRAVPTAGKESKSAVKQLIRYLEVDQESKLETIVTKPSDAEREDSVENVSDKADVNTVLAIAETSKLSAY